MKKIIVLLLVFILSGCVGIDKDDLNVELDTYLSDLTGTYKIRVNNSTDYFSYYLPSDMQEIAGNANSAVVTYNNSKAAINLNVKAIVNSEYYNELVITDEGFFKEDKICYENYGVYTKDDDTEANYLLKVYEDNGEYLVYLVTNDLCFYGSTIKEELVSLVKHFFVIAKSIEIDRDKIVSTYSNKDVIDYQKKQVDLFEYVLPSTGYLTDLVDKSDNVPNEEQIQAIEEDEPIEEETESIEDEDSK